MDQYDPNQCDRGISRDSNRWQNDAGTGSGKIINIASSMGVRPAPERICYSVSKAAVIQMTRALAVEWAPLGITVNCIAPAPWIFIQDPQTKGI